MEDDLTHGTIAAKQTPLANLRLTLLQGVGIETDTFGDATGTLGELVAEADPKVALGLAPCGFLGRVVPRHDVA